MNTLEAIELRRSIRKFKDTEIPRETLQAILEAAMKAPSGKNRQPWRFVVVTGEQRKDMVFAMREGMAARKARGEELGSAEGSARVMAQAPATVFILNPYGLQPWLPHTVDQMFTEVVDTQSIGAAIQNLILAAQDFGLGSLWICDVFYAYDELRRWLAEGGELIAAVALGYPAEKPRERPRKAIEETIRFV